LPPGPRALFPKEGRKKSTTTASIQETPRTVPPRASPCFESNGKGAQKGGHGKGSSQPSKPGQGFQPSHHQAPLQVGGGGLTVTNRQTHRQKGGDKYWGGNKDNTHETESLVGRKYYHRELTGDRQKQEHQRDKRGAYRGSLATASRAKPSNSSNVRAPPECSLGSRRGRVFQ